MEPHRFFLLIDEQLSRLLVKTAALRGFRAVHVNDVGLNTRHDKQIARYAVEHDMIVVTRNRSDFEQIYWRRELHPGLIFLVANDGQPFSAEDQAAMLDAALDELLVGEPIQEAIVISLLGENESGLRMSVARHPLPPHD